MGSSAQNSSGVHWCRRGVRFNEVPENVPKVPEKVWEVLVQSQVMFNRVPEKVPKVWEALVQSQVRFNRVPEKVPEKAPGSLGSGEGSGEGRGGFGAEPGSGEDLGGFAAEPGQVQRRFRRFRRRFREALVQSQVRCNRHRRRFRRRSGRLRCSQVRFNRVPEKVPEKVPGGFGAEPGQAQQGSREGSGEGLGGFGESQVGLAWFSRICGLSIHGNQAGVYRALLRSAAHFRKMGKNATFRLLGIPPKLTRANQSLSSSRGCECTFGGSTVICPGMLWACTRAYCVHRRWC